jgi:AraC-like DNA-binding protein
MKGFPVIIFALTAQVRSSAFQWLTHAMQSGDVATASRLVRAQIEGEEGASLDQKSSADAAYIALLCGDLMLCQDHAEDAEECYRRAVKASSQGARGGTRVLSCRTTGFMNLYQQRYSTAAACFRRVVDDEAATPLLQVEALCGLALVHHGLGQQESALEHIDRAAELASQANVRQGCPELEMLVVVVRTEMRVCFEIRAHADLQDHVFWRTPHFSQRKAQTLIQEPPHQLAVIEACTQTYGSLSLVAQHLAFLGSLVRVTCGDARATEALLNYLSWLQGSQLRATERKARLEIALVAMVSRQVDVARAALEPLCGRQAEGHAQRWTVELLYCLARMHALSANAEESMKHYQRYALESVQCVRAEASEPALTDVHGGQMPTFVKDDVEMALTAKYRRAYRYMLSHLDCADLSVREIADEIGVTERALQSAFKAQVGMAPAEVLRRCRVERIRKDLLRVDNAGATVIETAARWGIANRSTLVSIYRRYFHETPAQTLQQAQSRSLA